MEGTGIGLALIKELIKLLDGSISVSSVVGQGTTFMVSIPADGARQHREQSGGGKRSISPATGALPYVEGVCVLAWLPDAAKGRQPAAESSVSCRKWRCLWLGRKGARNRSRCFWPMTMLI